MSSSFDGAAALFFDTMGKLKDPEIDLVFATFEPAIIKRLRDSGIKQVNFGSGFIEFEARGKLWRIYIKSV